MHLTPGVRNGQDHAWQTPTTSQIQQGPSPIDEQPSKGETLGNVPGPELTPGSCGDEVVR